MNIRIPRQQQRLRWYQPESQNSSFSHCVEIASSFDRTLERQKLALVVVRKYSIIAA